jgi:hypothetical protein
LEIVFFDINNNLELFNDIKGKSINL